MKRKLVMFKTGEKPNDIFIDEKMADEIETNLEKIREYHKTQEYKDKIKKRDDEIRATKKKVTDYVEEKFKNNKNICIGDWSKWDINIFYGKEEIEARLMRKKLPGVYLYVLMKKHKGDEVWFHHFTGPMFAI